MNGEADVQWPDVQGTMSRSGVNAIQLTTYWKSEDSNDKSEHTSGDKVISSDTIRSDEVREGGSNIIGKGRICTQCSLSLTARFT